MEDYIFFCVGVKVGLHVHRVAKEVWNVCGWWVEAGCLHELVSHVLLDLTAVGTEVTVVLLTSWVMHDDIVDSKHSVLIDCDRSITILERVL